MTKGKWKKRLLCGALTVAMLAGMIAEVPGGAQTVLAAEPTESVTQANEGTEFVVGSAEQEKYLASDNGSISYYSLVSHDYAEIKVALESDRNYHIRLDGDVSKSLGRIIHANDEAGFMIAADILTLGLTEIAFTQDSWAPTFENEAGRRSGGPYKESVLTPQYVITLGAGSKILELDGHDFTVENPDFMNQKATLFQVNAGSSFIIKDDKNEGEIFYDGYILDSSDYAYFKSKSGGDQQRDLIEVNGGTFTLNGGLLSGGRSKNESGFTIFTAKEKDSGDGYTGSATKYVNSTAIVLKSGEVTINKGCIMGRGYENLDTAFSNQKNAVIEAKSGKLTFNDGFVKAKGGADCFQIADQVETIVRMGEFKLHRNDALFCGQVGTGGFYRVDTKQPFGKVGIPENAIPTQTWVEYNTGYNKGKDMLNSSNWRTNFKNDVDGHHGKDDYEPWLFLYPDGGWGSLTALANPNPEIPEVDPNVKGQLKFQYNLESAFSHIPEEVRKTGGWERKYEFYIFNNLGEQLDFGYKKQTVTEKFGKKDYNTNYTLEIEPDSYLVNNRLGKWLYNGATYYVACTMTETYYGSKTYSVTTMAGKKFKCKNLNAPVLANYKLPNEKKVSHKGEEISLKASAVYANEVKWYKTTKTETSLEISEDEYTIVNHLEQDGNVLETTLTTKVEEDATYYCVFSNTIGIVKSSCKVSLPVSFINTDYSSVTVFKKYGGEFTQPIEGTLEKDMYFQWYYWGTKIEEVNGLPATANGNKLAIPANTTYYSDGKWHIFYCEIRQNGKADAIATSPSILINYVDEEPPERAITELHIGGLYEHLYVGAKAPTADQIYLKDSKYGVDPRARVASLTVTGVNNEGIVISDNPRVSIQFKTTAAAYYFEGTRESEELGSDYLLSYWAGSVYGNARAGSQHQSYLNVVIDYDGSTGHPALQRVPDTLLKGFDTFNLYKDEYVDIPLNVDLEMSEYSLNLGEKHYIASMSANTYSTNPRTSATCLPRGLDIVQTGTKTNAYGQTEPVYHLQGTVTHTTTPSTRNTSITVIIKGVDGYSNGRYQSVNFKYNVLPPREVTDEQVAEAANNELEEAVNGHEHSMSEWTHVNNTTLHQRTCSKCGYVEQESCDFYDLEVIQEATAATAGKKLSRCMICGYEMQRSYRLDPEGHVVTIDLNLGDGYGNQIKDLDVPEGEFTLPTLQFNHPDGKVFAGWTVTSKDGSINLGDLDAGTKINVDTDMICKAIWQDKSTECLDMHRLYNPNTGEHFYTAGVDERDTLTALGWQYEGIAWTAPVISETPVYRMFNPNSGGHHYTISEEERDMLVGYGWNYEGIGWYSDDNKEVPLYRLFNPNAVGQFEAGGHHYTTSVEERDNLISLGWQDEGIGWYGVAR